MPVPISLNNQLTDRFSINHLLSKLNNDTVAVLSCLLPIDGIGLPYFKKYLKKSHVKGKNILCLPLESNFEATLLTQKKGKSFMLICFDEVPLTSQGQNILPKFSSLMNAKQDLSHYLWKESN